MFVRATLVAATAAVLVPLLGAGTAHASCTDDATSRNIAEGYSISPKSSYWLYNYVEVSGTATVSLHGDDAVADWSSFATDDMPEYTNVVAGNALDITLDFVNCVAG